MSTEHRWSVFYSVPRGVVVLESMIALVFPYPLLEKVWGDAFTSCARGLKCCPAGVFRNCQ